MQSPIPRLSAALLLIGAILFIPPAPAGAAGPTGQELVEKAFNHMRGLASVSTITMLIKRTDWQREMRIKAWTRGQSESLFRILEPARDQGNATLKIGREMWMFNPKINRIIKVPPSMMSQSWMGSDFSNNDLAKSDSLLIDYVHSVEGSEVADGVTVYSIKSLPKPMAPVVWGMQTLKVREDGIFLEEVFYDEDLKPVKVMTFSELTTLGGRIYPRRAVMRKVETSGEFTSLYYDELEFPESLPDRVFTQMNLKGQDR